MNNVLEDSLFVNQNKKFDEIQSIVRQFSAEYVGNSINKDNIFVNIHTNSKQDVNQNIYKEYILYDIISKVNSK